MSGNFFGYTKEKFLQSPYQDLRFRDLPYDTNKKYNIYIPEYRSPISTLIEKEQRVSAEKLQQRSTRIPRVASAMVSSTASRRLAAAGNEQPGQQYLSQSIAVHPTAQGTPPKTVKIIEPHSVMDDIPPHNQSFTPHAEPEPETLPRNKSARQLRTFTAHSDRGSSANVSAQNFYSSEKQLSGRRNQTLRDKLYFDERTATVPKTTLKNDVIERIILEEQVITKNRALMDSIFKLKTLNLLNLRTPHISKFKGIGKTNYIASDYHSRHTNPGYSRNKFGTFYVR